jgi:uncharacterized membrane protein
LAENKINLSLFCTLNITVMINLSFLSQKDIPVWVTNVLLSKLKVNVTYSSLEQELSAHPDYPSLLSISDVIQGYGVENLAVIINEENLANLPTPFIAQIKNQHSLADVFAVVTSVDDGKVNFFDPVRKKWRELPVNAFIEIWPSRLALLTDPSKATGEKEYVSKRRKEIQSNVITTLSRLALPLMVLLTTIWRFSTARNVEISSLLYLLLSVAGSVTGTLLLWYELDEYNPFLQKICSAGKKVNCGAVLHSAAAKVAGVTWSSIGFSYFTGSLLLFLFTALPTGQILEISAWLSTLASGYILFSIYYQWRIAKQWCVLCLTTQAILALQLTIPALAGWHTLLPFSSLLHTETIISVIFSYLLPFSIIQTLVPLYKSRKENSYNKAELSRLKHNPSLFDSLLKKQKTFTNNTEGLGITIGNPDAEYKIVKICNPYCGPCSYSHIALGRLVQTNPNVQLQIIFFTGTNKNDPTRIIARHLLALAEEHNDELMEQALDDWYLPETKDYDTFASLHPVSESSKNNEHKIDEMISWVKTVDVHSTPSIFVNGHLLPRNYSVNDLKYFLSV